MQSLVKYAGTDTPTVAEAMKENGLDFDVVTRAMIDPFTLQQSEFWGVFGVDSDDKTRQFTTCKENYQPINNSDLFSGITPFVESGDMKIRNAGYMKDGARSFLLTELMNAPTNRIDGTQEQILPYMLTIANHDGNACKFKATAVNMFCTNQLGSILRKKIDSTGIDMRICHSGDVTGKLMDVEPYINQMTGYYSKVKEAMNILVNTKINHAQLVEMMNIVHPMKDDGKGKTRAERVHGIIAANFVNMQNSQKEIAGSAWAACNAISEFSTHQVDVKKANGNDSLRRLDGFWFGQNGTKMGKVYDYCYSLAA